MNFVHINSSNTIYLYINFKWILTNWFIFKSKRLYSKNIIIVLLLSEDNE